MLLTGSCKMGAATVMSEADLLAHAFTCSAVHDKSLIHPCPQCTLVTPSATPNDDNRDLLIYSLWSSATDCILDVHMSPWLWSWCSDFQVGWQICQEIDKNYSVVCGFICNCIAILHATGCCLWGANIPSTGCEFSSSSMAGCCRPGPVPSINPPFPFVSPSLHTYFSPLLASSLPFFCMLSVLYPTCYWLFSCLHLFCQLP